MGSCSSRLHQESDTTERLSARAARAPGLEQLGSSHGHARRAQEVCLDSQLSVCFHVSSWWPCVPGTGVSSVPPPCEAVVQPSQSHATLIPCLALSALPGSAGAPG